MTLEQPDPLLAALAGLTTPGPDPARNLRIRSRCHALLSPRDRRGRSSDLPAPERPRRAGLVDTLLAAAVGVYGAAIVAEAFKAVGLF